MSLGWPMPEPTAVPGGVLPPLVTPLTDTRQVDHASLDRLIRHVLAAGASGVLVLGSTGEGGHLTTADQEAVVNTAVNAAGDAHVMAGVPSINTVGALDLAVRLAAAGAHSLLVPPPLALDLSQSELASHFQAVSEAVGVPVIAYHVPSRVPTHVSAALLEELAPKGVLAGIKDSSGDLGGHREAVLATADNPSFRLFTGSETCIDSALLMGFHGAVAGLANVFASHHVALLAASARGDWDKARQHQHVIAGFTRLYQADVGVGSRTSTALGALKVALTQQGVIDTPTLTAPLTPVTDALRRHVSDVLDEVGVL